MLTRLKVSGFKNLVDVDVRFGPFTCIAGANGVGKSNLFDAIRFLSALADRPLIEAALSVRDEGGRTGDVRSLFHHFGKTHAHTMSFEAEMIVPAEGVDDLGQQAKASITFLRYMVKLSYRQEDSLGLAGSLELLEEDLVQINLGDAKENLPFPHKPAWRKSAVHGRRASPFISTETEGANRIIKLHQDGGSSGRPRSLLAANLPRTVLSVANAAESPTALLARREMQSWQLLQLEPSAMRKPDEFNAPDRLGTDGSHLAATLYHMARLSGPRQPHAQNGNGIEAQVYAQVANRLSELIADVREVWIDRDERRELLTLHVTGLDGTSHPARALSDGTLRFLALTVLELDPEASGVICLEEPENGIHPERIPAMLRLLQDIVTNVDETVGRDNPLRQVIINTHSPAVVTQVPDDSLLVAELKETIQDGQLFKRLAFSYLSDTWRQQDAVDRNIVSRGKLLAYLNPTASATAAIEYDNDTDQPLDQKNTQRRRRSVASRPDLRQLFLPFGEEA